MTDADLQRNRILVIVAHPDDAEFGAAGTVARFVAEGAEAGYVIATNGNKGTGDRDLDPAVLARMREEEQSNACAALGARVFRFLGHEDGGLEDAEPLREQVVRVIREFRPDTVITFDPYRITHTHRDHRVIGQVVLDALYPFSRDHLSYPEHLAEGLEPHKTAEALLFASDYADYWVEVSDTIHKKIDALRCHVSQVGQRTEDALRESIEKRGREQAAGRDMAFAEGFRRLQFGR